jgi:hypothetical protein
MPDSYPGVKEHEKKPTQAGSFLSGVKLDALLGID